MQYSKKELELIDQFIFMNRLTSLSGSKRLSEEEIVNNARRDVDDAIMQSIESGYYFLPENFGDLIFAKDQETDAFTAKIIGEIHSKIPYLYADGVRDQDISDWWNLSDVERVLMEKSDLVFRSAAVLYFRNKGMSIEQAKKEMGKTYVIYGDPSSDFGDPNRPIPYELKNRIMDHDEKLRFANGGVENKAALLFSSYNAYIRSEIVKGKV